MVLSRHDRQPKLSYAKNIKTFHKIRINNLEILSRGNRKITLDKYGKMFCDQIIIKDMKSLVIVESPTKARTLSRFLGNDYCIEATMGHVRDLPEKKLGITIRIGSKDPKIKNGEKEEYEFIPEYQVISDRKKNVAEIKKLVQSAPRIILATDPDREGEAIAWHIGQLLGIKNNQPTTVQRIVFHEITESAIKQALVNPQEIDMQLVDAQQTRRVLDRLVGYKLSPLLWNKLGKRWLSAGRVQTVAVRLIVEREREIAAFKPEEYWLIDVELEKSKDGEDKEKNRESFLVRLVQIGEKKAEINNKETADKVVIDLKEAAYKVANIEIKEVKRYPVPPFTTSTLQQTAANRYGWSAKRTMKTAQRLYEEGYISYHRTDSTNLASEAISMVRAYINNVYGARYLPPSPKFYKTKSKVAQEAHEAIRPTKVTEISNLTAQIVSEIGREAGLLYELIWKRFVACQMNEAVFDQTNIEIEANKQLVSQATESSNSKYLLRVSGEKMKFDGWMVVYDKTKNKEVGIRNGNSSNDEEKRELPLLTVGELLNFIQVLPQQKFTEPPPRYTEASLIKALEEKGIGRPSTYAPIISTIQDRKYVEKEERKFIPTDLGFAVNDFLIANFPNIFDISFTAKMEDELDEVANGKLEWQSVVSDFYGPFNSKLEIVFKKADRVKVDLGTTDEKCPKCASPMAIRLSKYGKFLACSNYPSCKFTKSIVEKVGLPCPACGADMVMKRTRRGKQFYGCSNYPACNYAAWKKEDIKKG